jgi:hypothetical protein
VNDADEARTASASRLPIPRDPDSVATLRAHPFLHLRAASGAIGADAFRRAIEFGADSTRVGYDA